MSCANSRWSGSTSKFGVYSSVGMSQFGSCPLFQHCVRRYVPTQFVCVLSIYYSINYRQRCLRHPTNSLVIPSCQEKRLWGPSSRPFRKNGIACMPIYLASPLSVWNVGFSISMFHRKSHYECLPCTLPPTTALTQVLRFVTVNFGCLISSIG